MNAKDVKHLPGRRPTCLTRSGCATSPSVRCCVVPPVEIRQLRHLTRYSTDRDWLVKGVSGGFEHPVLEGIAASVPCLDQPIEVVSASPVRRPPEGAIVGHHPTTNAALWSVVVVRRTKTGVTLLRLSETGHRLSEM